MLFEIPPFGHFFGKKKEPSDDSPKSFSDMTLAEREASMREEMWKPKYQDTPVGSGEGIIDGDERRGVSGQDIQELFEEIKESVSDADISELCGKEFIRGDIILRFDTEGKPSFLVRGSDGTDHEILEASDLRSESVSVSLTELRDLASKFSRDILSSSHENSNIEKASGDKFSMITKKNSELAEIFAKEKISDMSPITLGELSFEWIEGNLTLVRRIGNEQNGFDRVEDIPSIAQGVSLSELSKFYDEAKAQFLLRKVRQSVGPEGRES